MAGESLESFLSAGAQSPDNSRGQSAGGESLESFLGATPITQEGMRASLKDELTGEITKGLRRGVGNAATVLDMVAGLPGQALRVGANMGGRLSAMMAGGSADDAAWAGKALADQVPRSLTNPIGTFMEAVGFGQDYSENDVSQAMGKVMGVVERGGEWVEKATGKVVSKRDVEDLFETTLFALGAKGTAHDLQPRFDRLGVAKEDLIQQGPWKGMTVAQATEAARKIKKPQKGWSAQPREEPTTDVIPGLEVTEKFPTSEPDLTGPGWQTPRARPSIGEMLEVERIPEGEATEVIPTGDATELEDIPVGETKTIGGVVGERMAGKMAREAAMAAGVAGGGLALASLYPDSKDEIAAATAGAFLAGRGKGLKLEDIRALPDATPLKIFRDASASTLTTLERLPEKRFEFTKAQIEQELKRPDVTKGEKEIFARVLARVEGDKITAKQLYEGVKLETGDWELTRNVHRGADYWADYGLGEINRTSGYDPLEKVQPNTDPTTNIYSLPYDTGRGSAHFPREQGYFGHTRSFREDGIQHVVEIQNDVVQQASRSLEGEARARVEEALTKGAELGPRAAMMGGVDSKLLSDLAVIGLGSAAVAYLSSEENRARNAGLAAALIALTKYAGSKSPAVADWIADVGKGADKTLGVLSTRIRNASEALRFRLIDHERRIAQRTNESLAAVQPFVTALRKLPQDLHDKLNRALLSGDRTATEQAIIASGDRELQKAFETVQKTLREFGNSLMEVGKLKSLLIDYYPRIVVDVPGLLEALGGEAKTELQAKIDKANQAAMLRGGQGLTEAETSGIINQYLQKRSGSGRSGFLQKRTVGEVTEDLSKFYAPASESLPIYLRAMSKEIERARFFKEDLVRDPDTGVANLDMSIGNVVERERRAGNLSDEQIDDLREMLHARFGPGERAMSGPLQTIRNLTNAGLLGTFLGTVTQFGDLALPVAAYGILPTIRGLVAAVTRSPHRATVRDIGLVDHINEELAAGMRKPLIVMGREVSSAKFLEKVFKYTAFSGVDQLGKTTTINAALGKYRALAKTEAGQARIKAEYGKALGPEVGQLVADLRSGEMTELVRTWLFAELSDLQPISKLEVPQAYLNHPNGRIMYMLRTYMIKQADIVRRKAIGEMKSGNVTTGVTNLLKFGLALGVSGATTGFVTNWILGRDNKLEWGDIPENALKTFGWSSYVTDQARQGHFVQAVGGAALPPWKMWDQIVSLDPKAIQYLPPLGKIIYNRELGGAELANKAQQDREAKQAKLDRMTDAQKERMRDDLARKHDRLIEDLRRHAQ